MVNYYDKHKFVSKKLLAELAGVSARTFSRYISSRRHILDAMGVKPKARLLPPQAVKYVCEDYCIDLLKPLAGRKIKVFPDTDGTMSNYVSWLDLAKMAHDKYHIDIGVSYYLEEHATAEQKERKIDLVDFLIESHS